MTGKLEAGAPPHHTTFGNLLYHPEALVLLRHLEEVTQPLLKGDAAVPRRGDPADANPLVRRGETLEVLPGGRVAPQPRQDIGRQCGLPAGVRDGREAGPGHAARPDEAPHALAIHVRQLARFPPRREPLRVLLVVERFEDA